jgi:hypothetical protein
MQSIQPKNLSDEEILRQVYLMGNEMLPKEWVEELCSRLAASIDKAENKYDEGFADGFADGIEHANEFPLNK